MILLYLLIYLVLISLFSFNNIYINEGLIMNMGFMAFFWDILLVNIDGGIFIFGLELFLYTFLQFCCKFIVISIRSIIHSKIIELLLFFSFFCLPSLNLYYQLGYHQNLFLNIFEK